MTKSKNKNLHKAKREKNDEFYTQLEDISAELKHYRKHFKNKVVFCNCDDPEESNFFQYFYLNFKKLQLKKLITTHYHDTRQTYVLEYTLDNIGRRRPKKTPLKGNGDFRSAECIELLKSADIVVTNPPFSLFREYIAQLMEYDKKFLVIGSMNSVGTIELFNLVKDNKIWFGYNSVKEFLTPDGTYQKFGNINWYTNLTHKKRNEELLLYKKYTPKEFPKYDNYDAIEVGKVADIPVDYNEEMGVPISFLTKYNPKQFEIVGLFNDGSQGEMLGAVKTDAIKSGKLVKRNGPVINKKIIYGRIIIKRKKGQ